MGMRIRRWMPVLIAPCLLLAGVAAPAALAQPAGPAAAEVVVADAGTESQFVSAINSLRASKGLNQLQVSGDLVGMARRWTDRMVGAGQISHNPNLGSEIGGPWTKLGENVGVGYDVSGLMQAFINSPAHYANLVDPAWTHVGVGVTFAADGRMYTTHNFMALSGGAATSPAPAAPPPHHQRPPRRRPRLPTTTTTAPPPPPPPPPEPHPTPERVTAVLDPLRSLEAG